MRVTKKLTLSAALVALGTLFLTLGGIFGVLELTAAALASLLVVFAYIEIGSPYYWLVWLATSLLSALLFFGSTVWGVYLLIFGLYPIVKAFIERLKKAFWIPLKLVFAVLATLALMALEKLVFGVPLFNTELVWLAVLMFLGCVLAMLLFDYFLTVMIRVYISKYRKLFMRLLK